MASNNDNGNRIMAQTALNIVILAAGKGTRMYSKMPKVLHRIGGLPMVERVIDTAASLNPQNICVVIGHGKEQVLDTVKTRMSFGLNKPNSSVPATPSKPPCRTCLPKAARWCCTATFP